MKKTVTNSREETARLLKMAHQGDKKAREKLVADNLGLVWSIVNKYGNRGLEKEDLFQIGSIGLMKSIDRFDESFGVAFSTYAVPMITGELRRYLRDDGMIKISRSLKENAWKIKKAKEELEQKLGREARLSEVEERTGLSAEEIVQALDANAEVESIYRPVYQGEGSEICLADQVSGKEEKEQILNQIMVERGMGNLTEAESRLIIYRYFEEKTQSETAKLLDMSQVQVSRMEKKVLLKMRMFLTGREKI